MSRFGVDNAHTASDNFFLFPSQFFCFQATLLHTNDSVISQYVRPPEFAPYSLAPTQADVTTITFGCFLPTCESSQHSPAIHPPRSRSHRWMGFTQPPLTENVHIPAHSEVSVLMAMMPFTVSFT